MDFFNKAVNTVTAATEEPKVEPPKETTPAPTGPGVVESAKETAGAGVGKVAGATADLIGAGKEYAKLDTTQGVGKYVDQAETFARSYETSGDKKEEEGGIGGALKAAGGFFGK